jgi:hypothetical protein
VSHRSNRDRVILERVRKMRAFPHETGKAAGQLRREAIEIIAA